MPAATFTDIGVPSTLADLLAEQGITAPTPIQAATLPDSLAGRDVLGRGRTGSGKTLAFLLPLVTRLADAGRPRRPKTPRALILAPTRELVGQIERDLAPLAKATGLTTLTVFGGVGQQPQVRGLQRGVDVLVACPGRLDDLIGQGHASLANVEITVLDEADYMADLGFLPVVRKLLKQTPKQGQRLLFSATLDAGVGVIVRQFLHDPVTHEADSAQSPVAKMTHHVLHVNRDQRVPILVDLTSSPGRTVVFTRTKHGAKAMARRLNQHGVPTVELHGNLSQNARTRNMAAFHDGRAETLVATDVAARGIHVDDVALVIHADPPAEHKAYLHRSGRTARAGAAGTVVTLMTDEQMRDVRALTKAAGIRPTITRVRDTGDPVLRELAPGQRTLVDGGLAPLVAPQAKAAKAGSRSQSGSKRRRPSGNGNRQASGRNQARGRGQGHGQGRGRSTRPNSSSSQRRHSAADFSRGSR